MVWGALIASGIGSKNVYASSFAIAAPPAADSPRRLQEGGAVWLIGAHAMFWFSFSSFCLSAP